MKSRSSVAFARIIALVESVIENPAMIAMSATMIINSMSENPFFLLLIATYGWVIRKHLLNLRQWAYI